MEAATFVWGRGELAAVFIALIVGGMGLVWHAPYLRRPETNTTEAIGSLFYAPFLRKVDTPLPNLSAKANIKKYGQYRRRKRPAWFT